MLEEVNIEISSITPPVVLQGDHDVLGVGEDELSPGLPKRVYDVGYEPNLVKQAGHNVNNKVMQGDPK